MMHKPAHKDTMFPPGQIVHHLEVPLTRAVEDFRDDQLATLARRVQELELELSNSEEALHWARQSQKFWFKAACEAGWVSDQA
jgi:hypothetical protein